MAVKAATQCPYPKKVAKRASESMRADDRNGDDNIEKRAKLIHRLPCQEKTVQTWLLPQWKICLGMIICELYEPTHEMFSVSVRPERSERSQHDGIV
jgi:hypothetical protein